MKRRVERFFALGLGIAVLYSTAWAGALIPVKAVQGQTSELSLTIEAPSTGTKETEAAQVWVESREGKLLFEGKAVDQNGTGVFHAATTEAQLKDGLTITVFKPGYEVLSLRDTQASQVALALTQMPTDQYNTLKGTLKGFLPADSSDYVQLGLVAKALRVSDLAQLDPSSFISPWKDTIQAFGKREIPSNLVLPDQTISIFFMSVHLNKPEYRLPVLQGSSDRYFGVTAQAVGQDLVQALRNNADAYQLLDLLEFRTVGHSNIINTPLIDSDFNLDINAQTRLADSITLQPSPKNNAPEGTKHLAVALSEVAPGIYVPNDIKQVKNAKLTLASTGAGTRVMDIWAKGGDHIRGAWLEKGKTQLPEVAFDTTLSVPSLEGRWDVKLPAGTNLVVNRVEKRFKTSVGSNRVVSLWAVYGSEQTEIKLPSYALSQLKDKLTDATSLSVGLLEVGAGGYPLIDGEQAEKQLRVFEKVRTALGN